MSRMLSMGDTLRRDSSSSNHDFLSSNSTPSQTWNCSKFTNGPTNSVDIIEKSLNHPSLSQNSDYNASSMHFARELRNSGRQDVSSQNSPGFTKARTTPYLFDTGEPLGSLSSSIAQTIKTKLKPTREEMKEKLVTALSSDSNVGILPGYKSNGFTGGGFHGLRSSQSATLYGNRGFEPEPQRIPSPVARAQAAIGKTQQEVGLAQGILQGNNNRIAGIYRHPSGDKWLNASTPGAGCDSASVRRLKQDRYRRDLETQMEQSRLRKAVELKKDREGLGHPLGTGYNSHSIYTLSMDEPKPIIKTNSYSSNYSEGKTDSVLERPLNSSKSDSDKLQFSTSPWLDKQSANVTTSSNLAQPQSSNLMQPNTNNLMQQPPPKQYTDPANDQNQSQTKPYPRHPPRPPPQQQSFAPNPYYPSQPSMPMYPYPYPYSPQPPGQVPFQMFSPPIAQMQQFQQYPQQSMMLPTPQFHPVTQNVNAPIATFQNSSGLVSPRTNANFDLQLQKERFLNANQKEDPMSNAKSEIRPVTDIDGEVDETAIRQHIWQTSDQLASDDLKKAMYQTLLKRQIIEKQRQTEEERVKEAEDNQKLERNIEEYQAKMRKQIAEEQLFIKKKQGVNGIEELNWPIVSTPKMKQRHCPPTRIVSDWNIATVPREKISKNDLDEKPIKLVHLPEKVGDTITPTQLKMKSIDQSEVPSCLSSDAVTLSSGMPIDYGEQRNLAENGDGFSLEKKSSSVNLATNCDDDDDVDILSQIRNALTLESRRMENLMGRSKGH